VSARFVNSLRWSQCLAVLVSLVVLMGAMTPLVASPNQEDGESAPVIAIARARISGAVSRGKSTERVGTSREHTTILVVDTLESVRDNASPRVLSGRGVLDLSSSFRC